MQLPIPDRAAAGQALAQALQALAGRTDVTVLALPRGGVPVAFAIAQQLQAPLDLMLVRKLGTPGQPELAMGAIAPGVRVLNPEIIQSLGITDNSLEQVTAEERQELERRQRAYRGDRPWPALAGRQVILVDDGIATGATMRAAIAALRALDPPPARILVATPIAPVDTLARLQQAADQVICLATPQPFLAIGQWYRQFGQTSDQEVKALLAEAWRLEEHWQASKGRRDQG